MRWLLGVGVRAVAASYISFESQSCLTVKTRVVADAVTYTEWTCVGDSRACASVGTDPVYGDVSSLVQVSFLL